MRCFVWRSWPGFPIARKRGLRAVLARLTSWRPATVHAPVTWNACAGSAASRASGPAAATCPGQPAWKLAATTRLGRAIAGARATAIAQGSMARNVASTGVAAGRGPGCRLTRRLSFPTGSRYPHGPVQLLAGKSPATPWTKLGGASTPVLHRGRPAAQKQRVCAMSTLS